MGEIKSVKVDNWGVFFLQKLQNFFNKTDYCDLTLQFNDNSQLKVHRLVLNACTDYFNILEQTCEMIEDILIMPPGLQADVVVPIVNFMYTGTLEFELKMYGRLLKTAKDMNMTVLLKLLEAHRRTMEGNKVQIREKKTINKAPVKTVRRAPYNTAARVAAAAAAAAAAAKEERITYSTQSTSTSVGRRGPQSQNTNQQYCTVQIKPVTQAVYPRALSESAQILTKYPHSKTPVKGPSRFDCAEATLLPEPFEKSFDNISYESKPLIVKDEADPYDYDNLIRKHETYSSTFERLRESYTNNNNKRPASSVSSYDSPPEKKPNIEDVKEYAEQQRMRKQIAEEYDDDHEYDEQVLEEDFHNDDDDDDYVPPQSVRRQVKLQQQQHAQAQNQGQSTTTMKSKETTQKPGKQEQSNMRPTIVVKDTTSTNVNHARIISEVLRKYPHLVKNNKNIKLKIMAQSNNAQKVVIKRESTETPLEISSLQEPTQQIIHVSTPSKQITPPPQPPKKPTPVASTSSNSQSAPATTIPQPPRRIDSKTMHALIAMGAENRTGPWLCLRCGVNGRPISIPSYRGFRRHLINTHKEKIDPRLCEHCGWRSAYNKELAYHMLVEHSIKTNQTYNFPKCELCTEIFLDPDTLSKHIIDKHTIKKEKQLCIYCNRTFTEEMVLYKHMKAFHKQRAIEDGVLDISEEDDDPSVRDSMKDTSDEGQTDSKIKIISDISLPKTLIHTAATATTLGLDTTSLETTSDIGMNLRIIDGGGAASGDESLLTNEYIGTDSSQGPKFVNADGNEMDLTPAQREEIISQLDQQHDGIVMVLNEENFDTTTVETVPLNTATMITSGNGNERTTGENSMFIVCGQEERETVSDDQGLQLPSSPLERAKSKSKDPLEWANDDTASNHSSNVAATDKDKKNDDDTDKIDELERNLAAVTEGITSDKKEKNKDKSRSPSSERKTTVASPETVTAKEEKQIDSMEMKLKLLTDWTDDEEEDEEEEQATEEKVEKSTDEINSKEKPSNDNNDNSKEELFDTLEDVEAISKKLDKDIESIQEKELSKSNERDEFEEDKEATQDTGKDEVISGPGDDEIKMETEEEEAVEKDIEKISEKKPADSKDNDDNDDDEELNEKDQDDNKSNKNDDDEHENEAEQDKEEKETPEKSEEKSERASSSKDTTTTTTTTTTMEADSDSRKTEDNSNLITKAELRNIMSDWVDDDGDDDDDDDI